MGAARLGPTLPARSGAAWSLRGRPPPGLAAPSGPGSAPQWAGRRAIPIAWSSARHSGSGFAPARARVVADPELSRHEAVRVRRTAADAHDRRQVASPRDRDGLQEAGQIGFATAPRRPGIMGDDQ